MTATFFPVRSGGVLVASPSVQVRDQFVRKLGRHGPVHTASGGAEALARLESGEWQMLFLDRRLRDLDAVELVEIIERKFPGIRVVLVDAEAQNAEPASALAEYQTPALDAERKPATHNLYDAPLPGMIGDTHPMRAAYRLARLVAARDTTVLITGPTGSGKDVMARGIHQLSPRSRNEFTVLNCAAIPESLVESELFGYTRGAFTGATQTYAGRILAAGGGTLFLDEIGDLPLTVQSKLLRFLEHKEIQRLGSAETTKADVRLVAATNRNLAMAVKAGEFREDLYFRLSAFPIRLAPLAERGADIIKLARYFLLRLLQERQTLALDPPAARKLEAHPWPGNVRELQQVIERATILAGESSSILAKHIVFSGTEHSEEDA